MLKNTKFVAVKEQMQKRSKLSSAEQNKSPLKRKSPQKPVTPWALNAIDSPKVWSEGIRGQGVKVLVLDSGIELEQPMLLDTMITAKDFTGSDDGRLGVRYPVYDPAGHGTSVASIILSKDVGVAPDADLFMAKVCIFECDTFRAKLAEALDWGLSHGVRVVNMSFGYDIRSSQIQKHLMEKLEENEVVVVAAAGNHRRKRNNKIFFPANIATVLAVGAVNKDGVIAEFSNTGEEVDVVAPGVNVLTMDILRN